MTNFTCEQLVASMLKRYNTKYRIPGSIRIRIYDVLLEKVIKITNDIEKHLGMDLSGYNNNGIKTAD